MFLVVMGPHSLPTGSAHSLPLHHLLRLALLTLLLRILFRVDRFQLTYAKCVYIKMNLAFGNSETQSLYALSVVVLNLRHGHPALTLWAVDRWVLKVMTRVPHVLDEVNSKVGL